MSHLFLTFLLLTLNIYIVGGNHLNSHEGLDTLPLTFLKDFVSRYEEGVTEHSRIRKQTNKPINSTNKKYPHSTTGAQ